MESCQLIENKKTECKGQYPKLQLLTWHSIIATVLMAQGGKKKKTARRIVMAKEVYLMHMLKQLKPFKIAQTEWEKAYSVNCIFAY